MVRRAARPRPRDPDRHPGRDAWSRELTERWLSEHLPVPIAGLHMRAGNDYRSNAAIKREIHSRLARTFDDYAAIDDDPEIVGLWQEIGIPVALVLGGVKWWPLSSAANPSMEFRCRFNGLPL